MCRISFHVTIWRNILKDNRSRRDDAASSDRNSRQDNGSEGYPRSVLDRNRLDDDITLPAALWTDPVTCGVNEDVRTNAYLIANSHGGITIDSDAVSDDDISPQDEPVIGAREPTDERKIANDALKAALTMQQELMFSDQSRCHLIDFGHETLAAPTP